MAEGNGVGCGWMEEKMGMDGKGRCVMKLDKGKGLVMGGEKGGVKCMLRLMKRGGMGTGVEGVGGCEG